MINGAPQRFPPRIKSPHAIDGNGCAESGGCAEGMGGEEFAVTDLPRDEYYMDYIEPLAGPCACGNAGGVDGPACRQESGSGGCGEGAAQGAGRDACHEIGAGAEDHRGEEHYCRLRSAAEIALERFRDAG